MTKSTTAAKPAASSASSKPTLRQPNKLDPKKVKVGDLMAVINYVKVKKLVSSEQLLVEGLDEGISEFMIEGKDLIENCLSGNQFSEEKKVTMTACAEVLISSYNRPFEVCFTKQDGTDRVLRGRLIQPEHLLGRSHVEDLETTEKHRLRLVDHRTIKYLIVDGIKYTVK